MSFVGNSGTSFHFQPFSILKETENLSEAEKIVCVGMISLYPVLGSTKKCTILHFFDIAVTGDLQAKGEVAILFAEKFDLP